MIVYLLKHARRFLQAVQCPWFQQKCMAANCRSCHDSWVCFISPRLCSVYVPADSLAWISIRPYPTLWPSGGIVCLECLRCRMSLYCALIFWLCLNHRPQSTRRLEIPPCLAFSGDGGFGPACWGWGTRLTLSLYITLLHSIYAAPSNPSPTRLQRETAICTLPYHPSPFSLVMYHTLIANGFSVYIQIYVRIYIAKQGSFVLEWQAVCHSAKDIAQL